MKENNIFKRLWLWFRRIFGYDTCDSKPLEEFKNEEAYLLYLASESNVGPRTKKAAVDALRKRHPDGLYSLWKKQCSKQYTIEYKYKNMQQIHCTNNNEFCVDVQYRVVDKQNKVILKDKRTLICVFDNTSLTTGVVNPFYGLEYKDLSREVREQILLNKLKELIQINLKTQKWSDWNEAIIVIDEEE